LHLLLRLRIAPLLRLVHLMLVCKLLLCRVLALRGELALSGELVLGSMCMLECRILGGIQLLSRQVGSLDLRSKLGCHVLVVDLHLALHLALQLHLLALHLLALHLLALHLLALHLLALHLLALHLSGLYGSLQMPHLLRRGELLLLCDQSELLLRKLLLCELLLRELLLREVLGVELRMHLLRLKLPGICKSTRRLLSELRPLLRSWSGPVRSCHHWHLCRRTFMSKPRCNPKAWRRRTWGTNGRPSRVARTSSSEWAKLHA
jgi:hypothetical protein